MVPSRLLAAAVCLDELNVIQSVRVDNVDEALLLLPSLEADAALHLTTCFLKSSPF